MTCPILSVSEEEKKKHQWILLTEQRSNFIHLFKYKIKKWNYLLKLTGWCGEMFCSNHDLEEWPPCIAAVRSKSTITAGSRASTWFGLVRVDGNLDFKINHGAVDNTARDWSPEIKSNNVQDVSQGFMNVIKHEASQHFFWKFFGKSSSWPLTIFESLETRHGTPSCLWDGKQTHIQRLSFWFDNRIKWHALGCNYR